MISKPRKQSPDAPSGISQVGGSRMLRMARAGHGHHEPTSAELKLARHMAQDGANWKVIHAALGWPCTNETTVNRLKKFNIFVRSGCNSKSKFVSKFGGETGTPENFSDAALSKVWRSGRVERSP